MGQDNGSIMAPQEMQIINDMLLEAQEHGLTFEVVTFALTHMKRNPSLSIMEALEMGYVEWIK